MFFNELNIVENEFHENLKKNGIINLKRVHHVFNTSLNTGTVQIRKVRK